MSSRTGFTELSAGLIVQVIIGCRSGAASRGEGYQVRPSMIICTGESFLPAWGGVKVAVTRGEVTAEVEGTTLSADFLSGK